MIEKSEVQYAQEAYDLFKWLVKNPDKRRRQYPGIRKILRYESLCPACEWKSKRYSTANCTTKTCTIRTACLIYCRNNSLYTDGNIRTRRIVRDSCKKWLYRAKKRGKTCA